MTTNNMVALKISKPKRGAKDVHTFCGWNTLDSLINSTEKPMVKGLMSTLFLTGCRVSECLQLRPEMFNVDEEWVRIYGVPVLKKGKHAEARERIRTVIMPQSEPLVPYMLAWLKERERYDELFPYGRRWAYKWIRKTDSDWWPHRFRAERASQLVIEYRFRVPELMAWFNWSEPKTPTQYVRLDMSNLEAAMTKRREGARPWTD